MSTERMPRAQSAEVAAAAPDLHTCAEEILHLLAAHGIEVLFLNPGTDSAPLQEAFAALSERGVAVPRIILSTFESVSLAAAHGYWQATQRPQAVFVHVDVGTQNLGAMVHDVLRDRAGAVVLAGKTPYGEDALSPGARSSPIHWRQDVPDQAGIVRPYAKWSAELTRSHDTARVVGRAVQVASGGIPGVSYLTLSRDVLMEPAGPPELRRTVRFARPVAPAIEPAALAELAERLAYAERPLIVTNRAGRTAGGAEALGRLSELAAIPVTGRPETVNVVSTHPMCVRSQAQALSLLKAADLVLIVDCDVPWIPRTTTPAPDSYVVEIDRDPIKADMPLWTFPVDLALTADPAVALRQLTGALESHAPSAASGWEERRRSLEPAIADATRSVRGAVANQQLPATDIRAVVLALSQALDPSCLVVEEAVSNLGPVAELLDRPEPCTLHSAGGPGLGWALGAAVGIKLARPDRQVVALVGDGAFMFGVPTAALALAAEARAPVVIVVLNNGGYRASRLPVLHLFPDGVSAARGEVVGTSFAQAPDFLRLAEACGACGTRTEGADGLPEALARALNATREGKSAVIDVRVEQD
ncbi:MAG TPA: thiamine pyrophosphate-requiring protein [Solirubrobacteraceae bacterium]|nr:thiamine pyrophosphate-requiring protein [Solirubrobacteraceae bacterium]